MIKVFVIILFLTPGLTIFSQEEMPAGDGHFLTIFVMSSIKPINWESPATLYESTLTGYKAKLLHHRQYLLGHMIARLESPLAGGTIFSAMVSTSAREKRVLMLKEKIGLGILGISMAGKLDADKDILKDLKLFSRINKLAYVKYNISEESARKIILFMNGFSHTENGDLPPCNYYGGAFWPRYLNEGSGCTAYGMSMIDVAGLIGEEHNNWEVNVNIPMDLIGGELNGNKKVPKKEILESKSWACDTIPEQVPIPFSIYDPSLVYDWIINQRNQTGEGNYVGEEEDEIPGLISDRRQIKPASEDPIFLPRPDSTIFIELFKRKNLQDQ